MQFKVRVKNAVLSVQKKKKKELLTLWDFGEVVGLTPFFGREVGSQTRTCDLFDCPF